MRTKEGCGVGECGSCTVIMDKKAVASCLVLAVDADGSEIVTTEGMSCDSELQPMQEMFVDHLALQARIGVSTLSARQEYLTFCHLCCGHCAVKVTVADNVIVDMAPDFESGLSNEQCVFKKGRLSIPEIHSHPDRLLHPLKRVGARGEGKWERISWEEALDTIADKFRTIREESGPEYVAFALGEPHGLEFAFAQRFASVFGTPQRHHTRLVLRGAFPVGQRLHVRPGRRARRGGDSGTAGGLGHQPQPYVRRHPQADGHQDRGERSQDRRHRSPQDRPGGIWPTCGSSRGRAPTAPSRWAC